MILGHGATMPRRDLARVAAVGIVEFRIRLAGTADLAVITEALQRVDPAAVVDRDPWDGRLRATVWMDANELEVTLTRAGFPPLDVEQQPSNCCGDCSG